MNEPDYIPTILAAGDFSDLIEGLIVLLVLLGSGVGAMTKSFLDKKKHSHDEESAGETIPRSLRPTAPPIVAPHPYPPRHPVAVPMSPANRPAQTSGRRSERRTLRMPIPQRRSTPASHRPPPPPPARSEDPFPMIVRRVLKTYDESEEEPHDLESGQVETARPLSQPERLSDAQMGSGHLRPSDKLPSHQAHVEEMPSHVTRRRLPTEGHRTFRDIHETETTVPSARPAIAARPGKALNLPARSSLKKLILWNEILGPPLSLRDHHSGEV